MQQHSLLQTNLHIPPLRSELVSHPRLNAGLPTQDGYARALTLVSVPAGFGKTTLVSEWVRAMGIAAPPVAAMGRAAPPIDVAWPSLDEGDNGPARFLS
jgi:LuxR family maltose regulon positive regulatory protein